jgi:cyanophycin synthetase
VQELVDATNADPLRAEGHESILTKIKLDEATTTLLARQGLTLQSVPDAGQKVVLKGTANISTGGTAVDVTDEVHPEVRKVCERAARMVGLDVMGLDIVAPTLAVPLEESGGAVVEVNAAPGLRMHLQPSHGTPRNVAKPIIDMLFTEGDDGRIPIIAVTGTNGKTTTVRMTAHILASSGRTIGLSGTSGVEVAGSVVRRGDHSGPDGARVVLRDPAVETAVLEVARGGILRRGLGYDQSDVGILLNVAPDHLGEGGIETIEDLARLKSVVIQNVRPDGVAVVNVEDPLVMKHARALECRLALFALGASEELERHAKAGGLAVTVRDGTITILDGGRNLPVVPVAEVPVTLGGAAWFNVANALAATAATYALGLTPDQIRVGLAGFHPTPQQLPGRMNVLEFPGFRVIVDYGHNVAAVQALASVVAKLPAKRRITVASSSGNRLDEHIRAFGKQLAQMYDHIIVCDPDPRERAPGETMRVLMEGIRDGGLPASAVEAAADEPEAIERALALAQEGDLVVVQADDVRGALRHLEARRRGEARTEPPSRPPRPSRRVSEPSAAPAGTKGAGQVRTPAGPGSVPASDAGQGAGRPS